MRRRWILVPLCLLCSLLVAQLSNASATLRVNEAATKCRFDDKSARLSLALENPSGALPARIRLELLDTHDNIRASVERDETIEGGSTALVFDLPLSLSSLNQKERQELLWYRLRYRINASSSVGASKQVEGLVSLSEVTTDIFALRVTDYQFAREGLRYHTRVRASHPLSERPVAGVKVEAELSLNDSDDKEKRVLKASGLTDATGYTSFYFDLPRGTGTDEGQLKVTGRLGDYVAEAAGDLMFDVRPRILITTDKPLYQPGQMLHARVLIFDSTMHALSGYESDLTITDPDRTTLFRARLTTSRYGVSSVDWAIPDNARLGEYDLNIVRDGDSVSTYRFKLSRYDLPNFTVNVKPDRAFYLPGQDAQVEVRASYLFGREVGRGRVRVVRETEREWDYREQKWKTEEGEKYEGETDAEGRFTAHVKLGEEQEELDDADYRRFRDLSYAAYFTDLSTNRTEERRFELRITKEPVHIYVIQSDDYQNALFPLHFYLSTFYADGSPAECEVSISEDLSESAGRAHAAATGKRRLRTIRTNSYGLAEIDNLVVERRKAGDDEISLSFAARDAKGLGGHKTETIWTRDGTVVRVETDKSLYRAGDSIRAEITSSQTDATMFVDVLQEWRLLRTETVRLRGGRASITLPYGEDFKDALTIIAYPDRGDPYRNHGTRVVLYPRERHLQLDVQPGQSVYRPGEEAQVDFRVRAPQGRAAQSALGVVVFDKAVEERMRTDEEFGSSGYGRYYNTTVQDLLGERDELAGVTRRDLNRLNLSAPVSKDLLLLAEVMLNKDSSYYPRTLSGEDFETSAARVFADDIRTQLAPVENALGLRYMAAMEYPTDANALRRALEHAGINFDEQRDPWGTPYRVVFFIAQASDAIKLVSAGADKRFDTADDFVALRKDWPYFRRIGQVIDRAVRDYHVRTGGFVRDRETLGRELLRAGFELDGLLDRWGRAYRFEFDVDGTNLLLRIQSGGEDGRFTSQGGRAGDDFTIWVNRMDYFAGTRVRVDRALQSYLEATRHYPRNDAELAQALEKSRVDPATLLDPWGHRYYAVFKNETRYADRFSMQNTARYGDAQPQQSIVTTTVTETLYHVVLRSDGADGQQGTQDDFTLGDFSRLTSAQTARDVKPTPPPIPVSLTGANGAIGGVVTDPQGAVIPGVKVKATHLRTLEVFEATTDADGRYLLRNLPTGSYTVAFDMAAFKSLTITEVSVASLSITDLTVQMQVGGITETVEVSAAEPQLQTTSATVSRGAELPKSKEASGRAQASTPRLREYFPETLVWQPSIETDAEGRAQVRFKLADNITTWKVAVIGSTLDGELGTAEQEIRAFQPFFIEHDPPRVLTEGDRVALPVVLRNYLEKSVSVDLEIEPESWFQLLGPAHKRTEVAGGDATREIFDFRATASIEDGRQRITATSTEAGDQIEKPITVHPDGEERTETVSGIFNDTTTLEWSVPTEVVKGTARAEVKIYPNLLTHVMESVEAIMQRPYGCAEQTISSSYPSLLVLSRDKQSGKQSPLSSKAMRYLGAGYERLLNYRTGDGGFSYWGRGAADLALTAYALRFLNDARDFIAVDEGVLTQARNWLISRQRADGSWPMYDYGNDKENVRRTAMLTSYIARVLAATRAPVDEKKVSVVPSLTRPAGLGRALDYLAPRVKEIDEPYLIASYALASLDAGEMTRAGEAIERLRVLAREDAGGSSYWALETNTPFYGWGLAGRIETTALAVQALSRSSEAASTPQRESTGTANGTRTGVRPQKANDSLLVNRGLLFLLRRKDRYGVWHSTQATVNVLDAMIALLARAETRGTTAEGTRRTAENRQAEVIVNGQHAATLTLPVEDQLGNPVRLDVSGFLKAGRNLIELKREAGSSAQASVQVVSSYYVPWTANVNAQSAASAQHSGSDAVRLAVNFDKSEAQVGDEVTCRVVAERVGFRGYGMMLAEVGLPPGADVDRASLERAMKDSGWSIGQYDVLPDRLVVYLWPRAGGTRFEFKFRPRFAIAARTAPSLIYDYYNPEARMVVAPTDFVVR